ncbi:MAG TPA: hypothetical protein VMM36_13725 [Opitutaceae bacterium]|nr:hypothetical protein [Opitutaceae bacterium]
MRTSIILVVAILTSALSGQSDRPGRVTIDFGETLQKWDGFGVNYVETAQTRDYRAWPQDYGGFSVLPEAARAEIIDLVFADDGLKPGIVKMFLDPFHEGVTRDGNDNNDPWHLDPARFDHTTTTGSMRRFVRDGLKLTRARGGDLSIITTLYGPPAWTTVQDMVRGADLRADAMPEVAEYIAAFARFLRDTEGFPVRFVSVHNEGLDPPRYTADGRDDESVAHHDYNVRWTAEKVAKFLPLLRRILDVNGLADVGIAPGETMQWYLSRETFANIAALPEALEAIGLITAHGFAGSTDPLRWNYCPSPFDPIAIRTLQEPRPDLHVWTTSTSWGAMDVNLIEHLRGHIYTNKNNAIIPWALIQRSSQWTRGDPNPGCAIRVFDDGTYAVQPGYYLYKQVTRAGQPGMRVAHVNSEDPLVTAIAFASAGSDNPDAFVLLNRSWYPTTVELVVNGTEAADFKIVRTIVNTFCERFSADEIPAEELFVEHPDWQLSKGRIQVTLPALSVTTGFAKED